MSTSEKPSQTFIHVIFQLGTQINGCGVLFSQCKNSILVLTPLDLELIICLHYAIKFISNLKTKTFCSSYTSIIYTF